MACIVLWQHILAGFFNYVSQDSENKKRQSYVHGNILVFFILNVYLVTSANSAFVFHNQWVSLSLLYPRSGNCIFDYKKKI